MTVVSLVNKSSVVSDADVAALAKALQVQVQRDFAPRWGRSCTVEFNSEVRKGTWGLIIMDTSDEAGALGYHDLTPEGLPLGKVFAADDAKYGYNWTITTSHEILEMLADPWIDQAFQITNTMFYALEVADACEADVYGYDIGGVKVSDFVYPRWFDGATQGRYDHKGHISRPTELLPGGYIGVWTPDKGWHQVTNFSTLAAHKVPISRRIPLRQKKQQHGLQRS